MLLCYKMNMVIRIYEAAKSNGLGELITKIDRIGNNNFKIDNNLLGTKLK